MGRDRKLKYVSSLILPHLLLAAPNHIPLTTKGSETRGKAADMIQQVRAFIALQRTKISVPSTLGLPQLSVTSENSYTLFCFQDTACTRALSHMHAKLSYR